MRILQSLAFLHWPVVAAVVGLFVLLQLRRARSFAWTLGCFAGIYAFLRFGFVTPIPASVVQLYMGITLLALAAYVSSSARRREEFLSPLVALVNEPGRRPLLGAVLVLLPALAAGSAWLGSRETLEAPAFGRTVHPAPPDTILFGEGKTIDLAKGKNPLRELETTDKDRYRAHVENGRNVYYRNCHFCHGDALAGDGMYAHALNPIPTNFTDPGTIAQLQESFLFWRIAKGGPGLPAEGGPWDSAMPAWEGFLTEQEIWEVILFLYDHTGQRPRAAGVEH
jgi:mono/diheme cytochrome c family protein